MATYDLIKDYTGGSDDVDDAAVDPYWVIAVVRLSAPVTFSRTKLKSFSSDASDAAGTRGDTLVITSCYGLGISSNKGEHLHSLQAEVYGDRAYETEILPGDWVLAWIVNGEDKFNDLIARIKRGEQCNKWDDGFKFLGRAGAPRRLRNRAPDGSLQVRYSFQAKGFAELDSSVFYDPHLAENAAGIDSWLAKLGKAISDLIENPGGDANSPGAISINQVIPYMSELLLGSGVTKRFANPADEPQLQIATGAGSSGEAPFAYLVPKAVGDLLGKTSRDVSKAGGILAYADVMELLYGVQRYQSTSAATAGDHRIFVPDGVSSGKQQKYTGHPMMGLFTPDVPTFSGRSVWTILGQYLNPTVNEMYTAMRANEQGEIVPTVVVRQMPFSSDLMAEKSQVQGASLNDGEFGPADGPPQKMPEVTPFLELPRWRIPPVLVRGDNLGRSDVTRFNFIQILGQATMGQQADGMTYQIVRNPPIRDDLDIMRSGLRPYQSAVACSYKDAVGGPRAWTAVASDWLMGQHLTFTGPVTTMGIFSPICCGDNVEHDGMVLHVESINHACSRSPSGAKSFTTSLGLTHGVEIDPAGARAAMPMAPEDAGIYARLTRYDSPLDQAILVDGDQGDLTDAERAQAEANYEQSLQRAGNAQALARAVSSVLGK